MQSSWLLLGQISFWLTWPLSYLALRGSQRTRALIIVDDQVLLVKSWLGGGKWGLPGGGLHRQETPVAGLIREVREEVGLQLPQADYQPLGQYQFRAYGLPFTCHLFSAYLPNQPVVKRQRLEIATLQWCPLSQLSTKDCLPDVLETAKRLAEQG